MKLIPARDSARLTAIENLYLSAFPAAERKPFSLLLEKQREGSVEILSLEEDGAFAGLAILVRLDDLVLLDYFAVSPGQRGRGIGGESLKLLNEHCRGSRFFLEIEDVGVPSDNAEQRRRRRAFYLRHGYSPARLPALFAAQGKLAQQRLAKMVGYVKERGCRRSYLLTAFGEPAHPQTPCCDCHQPDWQPAMLGLQPAAAHPRLQADWRRQLAALLKLAPGSGEDR